MLQNVRTDRLSLAISLKLPQGDILKTTIVAKAWAPAESFISGTIDKLKNSPHREKKAPHTEKTVPKKKKSYPPHGEKGPHKREKGPIEEKKSPTTWNYFIDFLRGAEQAPTLAPPLLAP